MLLESTTRVWLEMGETRKSAVWKSLACRKYNLEKVKHGKDAT